jgi:hypothetical protein
MSSKDSRGNDLRCCDSCNGSRVIPKRMQDWISGGMKMTPFVLPTDKK